MADALGFIGLGPMGDPDPTDLISLETHRILFKNSTMELDQWVNTFKSWPSWSTQTPKWRDWFFRMSGPHRSFWEDLKIGHCINLSLSGVEKNEPLLIAAS